MTSNQSAVVSIALSCTIFELFDVEEYHVQSRLDVIRGHWKWHHLIDNI